MWENRDVFKLRFNLQINFVLIISMMLVMAQMAQATDKELAAKLKDELEYETKRRNDFKKQRQGKRTFEQEREKGLSLFLEEQEKWDLTREKGLNEQRASRLKSNEIDENSPEYIQDQKAKKNYEDDLEVSRKKQIETKEQVSALFKNKVDVTEEEELDIYNDRPRYALRARGYNKWSKGKSSGSSGSSESSGSGGGNWDGGSAGSSAPFDYPPIPNQDYVPSDNFDDLPPPPPMMPYEGYGAPGGAAPYYEGGAGGEFSPPTGYPPPPPDGGWDF
jgi:hypothetical protein